MAVFLSTYVNKVDAKGRVSLPASFRSALAGQTQVILFPSFKSPAIEGWSQARMQQLVGSMDQFDVFSDDQDNLANAIFAESKEIPVDPNDGRIILPQSLRDHAGISDQAAFVGRGAAFQIWEPAALDAHTAKARDQMRAGGISLKLSPRAEG